MPSNPIPPAERRPALEALRAPIERFSPWHETDERFRDSMLALTGQLEELWNQGEDDTLESDVIWTALYAFPALVAAGPVAGELVRQAAAGELVDEESASILDTLKQVRAMLKAFEPAGYGAALWREVLLAIYALIELFVLVDDDLGTDRCFQLLDTAEAIADRFSGAA